MNPPERHLAAVPDAPTTQRRGKAKTLEDARQAMVEDQAAVDKLQTVLHPTEAKQTDPTVQAKIDDAVAKLAEARNIANALDAGARMDGPRKPAGATAHTQSYRRGGKRRKRDLAAERATNEPVLLAVRNVHRGRRYERAAAARG